MRYLLLTCMAAGLLTACRSTKKIQTAIAKKDTVSAAVTSVPKEDSARVIGEALAALDSNRIEFRTFAAKINVDYRDAADKHYDLNATLRMAKDSAIWISVNAILGIEAMRMLITKDSVKLLDKPNKVYTARSINYLQDITALPMDLKTVQDLLIGNPVFVDSHIVSYNRSGGTLSLLSLGQWFKNLLTLNETDKLVVRSKLDDADLSRSRTAELSYGGYENQNGIRFATKRRINVVEKKKLDVALDFKQYSFNEEVSFPFSIPRNFKQR